MMGLDNPIHIAFLLVLLLLVFGAKRLPEMGRSLGAGLRGFKESISGETGVVHAEHARIAGAPVQPATHRPPAAEPAPVRALRQPDAGCELRPRYGAGAASRDPDVLVVGGLAPLLRAQLGFADQLHQRPVMTDRAVLEPAASRAAPTSPTPPAARSS